MTSWDAPAFLRACPKALYSFGQIALPSFSQMTFYYPFIRETVVLYMRSTAIIP